MPIIFDPPFKTLDSGLVLYAPLWAGELSGSPFNSKDRNKHLCTVTGALWTPQGRTFDGTDDQIDCGSPAILDTAFGGDTTGSYTYLWWQKVASAPAGQGFLNKGADPAFQGIYFGGTGLNIVFQRKVTADTNELYVHWVGGYADADANQWVHFALTVVGRSASGITLLKNLASMAITVNVNTLSSNVANTADNLLLGGPAYGLGNRFVGSIGESLIYNRALTPLEIKQIYLATKWRYS